jgi:hypothetical protein
LANTSSTDATNKTRIVVVVSRLLWTPVPGSIKNAAISGTGAASTTADTRRWITRVGWTEDSVRFAKAMNNRNRKARTKNQAWGVSELWNQGHVAHIQAG